MTSTKLFPTELQNKIRSVATILNSLNKQEAQQIIHLLRQYPDSSAFAIAKHLGLAQSITNMHLRCLLKTEVLVINEKEDQAFFSLDYKRLSKISSVIKHLAQ